MPHPEIRLHRMNQLYVCLGYPGPKEWFQLLDNGEMLSHHYPEAETILLVQDNLNTHTAGSFYEALSPDEAFELAKRFEFHYTPKKGSWLNMAEIELSALSKQCLDRRIASVMKLADE